MAYLNYLLASKDTEDILNSDNLFRNIAIYLHRHEQYVKALRFFDEAILKDPNDIKALLQRAECRAYLCQFEGALIDIKRAVALCPGDIKVMAKKAFTSYLCCEFERGMLEISTFINPVHDKDRFQRETVAYYNVLYNTIDDAAGCPLRDHYKIIKKLAWDRNRILLEGPEPKKRRKPKPFYKFKDSENIVIQRQLEKSISIQSRQELVNVYGTVRRTKVSKSVFGPHPFRPEQPYTTNIEKFMAEKYLEIMRKDKTFLKHLPDAHGIDSPNQKGVEEIIKIAKRTYKTLSKQQEVLRARKPFYFIKNSEAKSGNTVGAKLEELYIRKSTLKEAEMLYQKLKDTIDEKNYGKILELAEKFEEFCSSKPRKFLPCKHEYLREVIDIICNTYYSLKRINPNQYPWDQIKRIHRMFEMPVSREPSEDSIMPHIRKMFVDARKKISVFEKRLKDSEDSEITCHCLYELCRLV